MNTEPQNQNQNSEPHSPLVHYINVILNILTLHYYRHTPENDRSSQRDSERERRLQMTSPTDRRNRHQTEYTPPRQPDFGQPDNHRNNGLGSSTGFQLQPPFPIGYQWNNSYSHGLYGSNGHVGNNPVGQSNQPLAGPSSGAAYLRNQERDYMADLMTNFQRRHDARVHNRRMGRNNRSEAPQPPQPINEHNHEPQPSGSVYNRLATRRLQRQQEIDEQQRIEAEQHAARVREQEEEQEAAR